MDQSSDNEVRVVMKTTLPRKYVWIVSQHGDDGFIQFARYLVTDAPIAIPGGLRRKALSQMINSMLDLG
jgi:hypothetical protein